MSEQRSDVAVSMAIVIAFLLGAGFGAFVASGASYGDLCVDMLSRATSAADTLSIVQDDDYCLEYSHE